MSKKKIVTIISLCASITLLVIIGVVTIPSSVSRHIATKTQKLIADCNAADSAGYTELATIRVNELDDYLFRKTRYLSDTDFQSVADSCYNLLCNFTNGKYIHDASGALLNISGEITEDKRCPDEYLYVYQVERYNNYAVTWMNYFKEGNHSDELIRDIQSLLLKVPGNWALYDILCRCYWFRKDYDNVMNYAIEGSQFDGTQTQHLDIIRMMFRIAVDSGKTYEAVCIIGFAAELYDVYIPEWKGKRWVELK